jgi:diamine N-acetyltransferase
MQPNTPSSAVEIRPATLADRELLTGMGTRMFADTFAADNTPEDMAAYLAKSFNPEKQTAELSDPQCVFLIAEVDGQPVGYSRLLFGQAPDCVGASKPMEIVRLYADKEWIGRGIGARLMSAALDLALKAGCDVVWLDVWDRNERAIAFYRRHGFEVCGEQEFILGDDVQHDWLMSKQVNRAN